MTIPETQLETWANQGAITTSQSTHTTIRREIESHPRLTGKDFRTFLQGSYKNDTNIRGDSDVDIVVQLNDTFGYSLDALPQEAKDAFARNLSPATYLWSDFRRDVLFVLRERFGVGNVEEGNRALTVKAAPGRLAADVVVCQQYRRYTSYRATWDNDYVEGIKFWTTRENRPIINYPEVHYDNGVTKNGQFFTGGKYKSSVRMFKNARNRVVNLIPQHDGIAPSYFLECLLYNVPNDRFRSSRQDTYKNVLGWLSSADLDAFTCQNEQTYLFGSADTQWNKSDAETIILELIKLWASW